MKQILVQECARSDECVHCGKPAAYAFLLGIFQARLCWQCMLVFVAAAQEKLIDKHKAELEVLE